MLHSIARQFIPAKIFLSIVILCVFGTLAVPLAKADQVKSIQTKALDRVAIIVNEDVIMRSELYAAANGWKKILEQQKNTVPDDMALFRQVAEQLILLHLQLSMAKEIGIRLSDEEVNAALLAMAQHNDLTLDEFKLAIEKQGQSYPLVRSDVEQQLLLRKLQQIVVSRRVQVTDNEVNNFLATEKGMALAKLDYKIFYIRISIPETKNRQVIAKLADQVNQAYIYLQKDIEQAKGYLQKEQIAYIDKDFSWQKLADMPSLFTNIVPKISVGEVYPPVREQNSFHLVKLLEVKSDTPSYLNQVRVRHILLKPNLIRDQEQTKLLLENIRFRILAGESFNDLAATYSDDSNSAKDGGDLGWADPAIYTQTFKEQIESLPLHQLSPLFETEFGWHIVEVLETKQVDTAMEVERNRIKQYIFQQKLDDELPRWLNELRNNAYIDVPDPELNQIING